MIISNNVLFSQSLLGKQQRTLYITQMNHKHIMRASLVFKSGCVVYKT